MLLFSKKQAFLPLALPAAAYLGSYKKKKKTVDCSATAFLDGLQPRTSLLSAAAGQPHWLRQLHHGLLGLGGLLGGQELAQMCDLCL